MPRSARRGHLVLLDAHSLIYRAFFALPPMSTSAGQVTNAVYGFTSMLPLVLTSRPEYAIAAFDIGRPTLRLRPIPRTRQTRKAMPDDLRPQFELCRRVLGALSIPCFGVEGHEADDVIGTLARQGEAAGLKVTIVSGDLDCLQLVTDTVEALVPRRGISDTVVYGPEQVRQRYGLEPAALIDYKALRGDTSDNVPGVPGVGEKTASQLIQHFGSVENLLEHVDEITQPRVRNNLEERREQVMVAKKLVTIRTDLDVELDLRAAAWLHYDQDAARVVFEELEFRQLLQRLPVPDAMPHQAAIMFEPQEAGDVSLVEDAAAAEELARRLAGAEELGVFGLWEGGSARSGTLLGLGLAASEQTWYVPAAQLGFLRLVLESVPLQAHDVKELELALIAHGISGPFAWRGSSYLAAYLLGAGSRDPRLEDLARDLFGHGPAVGRGHLRDRPRRPQALGAAAGRSGRVRRRPGPGDAGPARGARDGDAQPGRRLPLPRGRAAPGRRPRRHGAGRGDRRRRPTWRRCRRSSGDQLAALETEVHQVAGQRVQPQRPAAAGRSCCSRIWACRSGADEDRLLDRCRHAGGPARQHPVVRRSSSTGQLHKLKSTYVDALPAAGGPA